MVDRAHEFLLIGDDAQVSDEAGTAEWVEEEELPLGNPYLGRLKFAAALALILGGFLVLIGLGSQWWPGAVLGAVVIAWAGAAALAYWVLGALLWSRRS